MIMKNTFEIFFIKNGVPKDKIKFYVIWLNKFIAFYSGSLDHVSNKDINMFLNQLKEDEFAAWQIDQARNAVILYIEKYCGKTIVSALQSEKETSVNSPTIATWQQAKERFTELIRLRHYAYNTEKTYQEWIIRFLLYTKLGTPQQASSEHVKQFLAHLAVERKVTASTQNQAFNALLFLFRDVLGIEFGDFRNTIRAKKNQRVPVVLTIEEIKAVFAHIKGVMELALTLIYASGIRVTECVRLRVQDLRFAILNQYRKPNSHKGILVSRLYSIWSRARYASGIPLICRNVLLLPPISKTCLSFTIKSPFGGRATRCLSWSMQMKNISLRVPSLTVS